MQVYMDLGLKILLDAQPLTSALLFLPFLQHSVCSNRIIALANTAGHLAAAFLHDTRPCINVQHRECMHTNTGLQTCSLV